ncbi:YceI family protein [Dyadobacter sp. 3J3]|uniref:YceI family protein n=1 Tax=Dyadobacter sp. 3J3 TaxID=2606600 RepID=UPI00135B36FB|nr:YceI family protein [Dyadobacter sp. 3J3]
MKLTLSIFILSILAFLQAPAQTSKVTSGSTDFSVKFVLGTCNGTFDAPKGSAIFDPNNLNASAFNLTIAANSFKTNSNGRDKDMKSDKYFDVAKYPEIRFKSSKIEKKGDKYQAIGTLTIRDVSKTVTLPFDAKKNADGSYAVSGTFDINRLDYKVGESNWKLKDVVTVTVKAVIK